MSHFTTVKTQIKDVEALRLAVQELGFELLENAVARGYGGQTTHGELVIKLPGPYDVALQKQADGTYAIVTDWWEGHVARHIGKNGGKLLQAYGYHKVAIEARKRGLSVHRQVQKDGSLRVTIQGVR